MTTRERIEQDYTTAAKAREAEKVSVLRMLRAAIKNAEIEKMAALEEKDVLGVIAKEVKKMKDSVDSFAAAGREDLAEPARKEMAMLESYMPAALSDDELRAIVAAEKARLGVQTQKEFGTLMSAVMQAAAGRADGARVKQFVQESLAS